MLWLVPFFSVLIKTVESFVVIFIIINYYYTFRLSKFINSTDSILRSGSEQNSDKIEQQIIIVSYLKSCMVVRALTEKSFWMFRINTARINTAGMASIEFI